MRKPKWGGIDYHTNMLLKVRIDLSRPRYGRKLDYGLDDRFG